MDKDTIFKLIADCIIDEIKVDNDILKVNVESNNLSVNKDGELECDLHYNIVVAPKITSKHISIHIHLTK